MRKLYKYIKNVVDRYIAYTWTCFYFPYKVR